MSRAGREHAREKEHVCRYRAEPSRALEVMMCTVCGGGSTSAAERGCCSVAGRVTGNAYCTQPHPPVTPTQASVLINGTRTNQAVSEATYGDYW